MTDEQATALVNSLEQLVRSVVDDMAHDDVAYSLDVNDAKEVLVNQLRFIFPTYGGVADA